MVDDVAGPDHFGAAIDDGGHDLGLGVWEQGANARLVLNAVLEDHHAGARPGEGGEPPCGPHGLVGLGSQKDPVDGATGSGDLARVGKYRRGQAS